MRFPVSAALLWREMIAYRPSSLGTAVRDTQRVATMTDRRGTA